MTPLEIARVCHAANRELQVLQADPTIEVSAPWDEVSEENRNGIESGVVGVLNGNTPEESHRGWVEWKVSTGWKLGPVKNEETKEHPLLIPYEELSPEAKAKDRLFGAIVKALA